MSFIPPLARYCVVSRAKPAPSSPGSVRSGGKAERRVRRPTYAAIRPIRRAGRWVRAVCRARTAHLTVDLGGSVAADLVWGHPLTMSCSGMGRRDPHLTRGCVGPRATGERRAASERRGARRVNDVPTRHSGGWRCLPAPTRPRRSFELASRPAFLGVRRASVPASSAGASTARRSAPPGAGRSRSTSRTTTDRPTAERSGGPTSRCWRRSRRASSTRSSSGTTTAAPLATRAGGVHRPGGAPGCPGGGGHGRRLRPHDARGSVHGTDCRSGRPQGIRGSQPPRPPQALGAG